MPVILSPYDYDIWLDPEFEGKEKLEGILRPYSGDDLETTSGGPGQHGRLKWIKVNEVDSTWRT